jgi:hypothetical protein
VAFLRFFFFSFSFFFLLNELIASTPASSERSSPKPATDLSNQLNHKCSLLFLFKTSSLTLNHEVTKNGILNSESMKDGAHNYESISSEILRTNPDPAISEALKKSKKNLEHFETQFNRSRTLEIYKNTLRESFQNKLNEITEKGGHWIDFGSGEGVALTDFLKQTDSLPLAPSIKVTSVSLNSNLNPSPRLSVFKNQYLEEIPTSHFQKADLISDLYGPIAYSPLPHIILKKYLEVLKDDGEIHLFLGSQQYVFGNNNFIITSDSQIISFARWIQNIEGLHTHFLNINIPDSLGKISYHYLSLVIRKQKDKKVTIPHLKLVSFKEDAPPRMIFEETSSSNDPSKKPLPLEVVQSRIKKSIDDFLIPDSFSHLMKAFYTVDQNFKRKENPLLSSIQKLKKNEGVFFHVGSHLSPEKKSSWENYDISDFLTDFAPSAQTWIHKYFSSLKTKGLISSSFDTTHPTYVTYPEHVTHVNHVNHVNHMMSHVSHKPSHHIAVIVDFYGNFVHSLNPGATLNSYLQQIPVGGKIFIFLGGENYGFGSRSRVIMKNHLIGSLNGWLFSLNTLKNSYQMTVKIHTSVNLFQSPDPSLQEGKNLFVEIEKNSPNASVSSLIFNGLQQQDQNPPEIMSTKASFSSFYEGLPNAFFPPSGVFKEQSP